MHRCRRQYIYITDYWAIEVRKINIVTGIITDYAGTALTGGYSGDHGPATAAKLSGPIGICIDTARKRLYFSDQFSSTIRMVNMLTDTITTFAGTGVSGYNGEGIAATVAKLNYPLGICLDRLGNLYIGDWNNGRIRKINVATGLISTVAGTGTIGYNGDNIPATGARVSEVRGITVDSCGNIYFSDGGLGGGNQRVRMIDASSGLISTIAGNGVAGYFGDAGMATTAKFSKPLGICLDRAGSLFVADMDNNRVRKVTHATMCISPGIDSATLENPSIYAVAQVSLYPDPARTTFILISPFYPATITITNPLGQLMLTEEIRTRQAEIDVHSLPPGLYLLRLTDPTGNSTLTRFIKQ